MSARKNAGRPQPGVHGVHDVHGVHSVHGTIDQRDGCNRDRLLAPLAAEHPLADPAAEGNLEIREVG